MPPKKKAKKNDPTSGDAPKKKAATNPDYINWKKSKAKAILIEDLIAGVMPLDEKYMSAEDAWELQYRHLSEFKKVVFKQFKERLKDHRKQLKGDLGRAKEEEKAVAAHRLNFPRNNVNQKGKLVFDMHPAKELLRQDIEDKKHIGMTPSAFRLTRDEYKAFDKDIFRHRIYQEIRRRKFLNFLESKHSEGKLLRTKPPDDFVRAAADRMDDGSSTDDDSSTDDNL